MESQLNEIAALLLVWVLREVIGYLKTEKKSNKILEENTKHIKENSIRLKKLEKVFN